MKPGQLSRQSQGPLLRTGRPPEDPGQVRTRPATPPPHPAALLMSPQPFRPSQTKDDSFWGPFLQPMQPDPAVVGATPFLYLPHTGLQGWPGGGLLLTPDPCWEVLLPLAPSPFSLPTLPACQTAISAWSM